MSSVAAARRCAFAVIRRVFEQGAYADRALHAEARGLDARDRALATALAFGTIQRRVTLDHVAEQLSSRALGYVEPKVLAALRLGLLQVLFLDGIAEHAAVNDSVELAKPRGDKFVNAVLRRATREGRAVVAGLSDRTPSEAAVLHSLPVWLAELWWDQLGSEDARELMARCNEPAESALRVNTIFTTTADVRERLPVPASEAPGVPEGLVIGEAFDAHGSSLFQQGAIMPQSRASMRVARSLSPRSGERVLDLCAAPGAKTTHLAALAEDSGEVIALERHPGRAEALTRTCRRMHVGSVTVRVADAAEPNGAAESFDRVLVDPPCSGLGTLQSRPDLRWRISRESIGELAEQQCRVLESGARAVAPGGRLVYSVCTVSRAESEEVVEGLIERHPELSLEETVQLLPHRDLTDGFFIARIRKRP